MAFIRWITGFVLAITITTLAVSNRQDVSIIWSPFHDPAFAPLYMVALGSMALGFIFGGIVVWLNMGGLRREKRRQKKELKRLETKLGKLERSQFEAKPPASDLFPALPGRTQKV